jgi:hypothetical protein
VQPHDLEEMSSGEVIGTTKHGERDLAGSGLALKPALLDPEDRRGLPYRVHL